MKTEELMIGDWVYFCHHDEWDSKTVCKVSLLLKNNTEFIEDTFKTNVNKKGIIQVEAIDGFQFWKMQEGINFEPIPLTPEILEKNGFKYSEWYGWQIKEPDFTLCFVGDTPHFLLDDIFVCDCPYVHTLQHALKLCGIEKDIIL